MTPLGKKLVRELWRMRGQALAIALVIAGGVATFVMSLSTLDSLKLTQATFYAEYRFAEVFASLKRAPKSLEERIRNIPGVDRVDTRVVAGVNIDLEGYADPVTGLLISVAGGNEGRLNALHLREGRFVDPLSDDEAIVSEAFAEEQQLVPGDSLSAIVNGRKKKLTIVGIALSPEYVNQIKPGSIIPDFKNYAILWMAEKPLATAYNMDGAFNNVALTLHSGANENEVIDRLDDLLGRYGSLGAYGRQDQLSHRYLHEEFRQLEGMATMYPTIFLGVAAFLLNIVFGRLFQIEREQIATLKAFGYSNFSIGLHYLQFVVAIALIGLLLGIAGGVWMGRGLSSLYVDFYRFPEMLYHLDPRVVVWAAAVTLGASFAGTVFAVRRAALQPPAEAMRPEPPARYGQTLFERIGLGKLYSEPMRMIARNLERRPVKALMTATGIAAAYATLVMGLFFRDSIDHMIDVQFWLAERDDITVNFNEPTSYRALLELQRIEGVAYAEGFRAVPVRLRVGRRAYRTSILGLPPNSDLHRTLDENLKPVDSSSGGLVLTDYLADLLGARVGDLVTVEVLEGARPVRATPLTGAINQFMGVSGYMQLDDLNRFMREGHALSGAYLAVNPEREAEIYRRIKEMPRVSGTEIKHKAIAGLQDMMAQQILIFAGVTTLLAGTIAFGVVYNTARVTLSERSRELSSLRVLGFTQGEAGFILLGELGFLTVLSLPLGAAMGKALCAVFMQSMQTDIFRIPLVLNPRTYAYAAVVILVSSLLSGIVIRRKINRLDLVGVLKTRE